MEVLIMNGPTQLTPEALTALNMSQPDNLGGNNGFNQTPKMTNLTVDDLYCPDKPKSMVETVQISAADLCHLVSEQLKGVFKDVLGCTFKYNVNGNLGFCILFQPGKGYGKWSNIDAIHMNSHMHPTQRYVETSRVNANGRRTMTLNQLTRDYFNRFMIRPVIGNRFNNTYRVSDKIEWEKCIEEVEYRESNMYGCNNASFLMLRNIDLERLLHEIWIPSDERKKDLEVAKIQFRNRFFWEEKIEVELKDDSGNPILDSDKESPTYNQNKRKVISRWHPQSNSGFNVDFDELNIDDYYDRLIIHPTHEVKVTFKGYRLVANNHIAYYPNPVALQPNGAVGPAPGNTYDLRNLFVNIDVVNIKEASKITPLNLNSSPDLANVF